MSWTRSYLVCISDVTNKVIPSSLSEMSWTRSYLAVCIRDVMNKVIPSSLYQWCHEQGHTQQYVSVISWKWCYEQGYAWQFVGISVTSWTSLANVSATTTQPHHCTDRHLTCISMPVNAHILNIFSGTLTRYCKTKTKKKQKNQHWF